MRMPPAALAAALTCVLAACASGSGPGTGAAGSPSPSSPAATASTTRTATPSPRRTVLATDLPDGKHYAHLTAFDRKQLVLTVDVVQFLTGAEAEKAAREDGQEAFDYYVRNQNKRLRRISVDAKAKVYVNTLAADRTGSASKEISATHAELAMYLAGPIGQNAVFWFRLKGGLVVEIRQQYLP